MAAASLASAGSPPGLGDGVTGVTRQKAEHEGDPLAGLTKRIRVMGMRDETGPGTSKGKGSEGHARNSALCAPEGARRNGYA